MKTFFLILTLCFNSPAVINNQTEEIVAELNDSFNLTNATMQPDVKGEAIIISIYVFSLRIV